jgi:hypothetical protein
MLNVPCKEALELIYSSFCERGHQRVRRIELDLKIGVKNLSLDDKRNEPYHFEVLLSGQCLNYFLELKNRYCQELATLQFEQSADVMDCLKILQNIASSGFDRYRFDLPDDLIDFIRAYERLDSEFVRKKLYQECKARYSNS